MVRKQLLVVLATGLVTLGIVSFIYSMYRLHTATCDYQRAANLAAKTAVPTVTPTSTPTPTINPLIIHNPNHILTLPTTATRSAK